MLWAARGLSYPATMSADPDPADEAASSPDSTASSPEPAPIESDTAQSLAALNNPLDAPELALSGDVLPGQPAAGEPDLVDPIVQRLRDHVDELTEKLESADRRADAVAAIVRHQSEMVSELHRENSTLRKGEIREAIAPLIRGLARLFDDLTRMQTGEDEPSADLTFLQARVAELLHDCGVLPECPEPGASFDSRLHRCAVSATTDDMSADYTIVELRRAGLRRDDGYMLRPADVVVYRYVAPVSPPPAEPDPAGEPELDALDAVETDIKGEEVA